MSKAEHDEKGEKPDSKTESGAAPSKADLLRVQLKHFAHYATIGFAPIVSAIALALAIVAVTGNQSAQEKLGKATAKLETMNTPQPAFKTELEKIKLAMAQEKAMHEEEIRKREEELKKREQELKKQEDEHKKQEEDRKKQDELMAKVIQNVSKLQVKMKISPTLADQLHQPAAAPAGAVPLATPAKPVEKKFSPQVQSMKEAIEQYNK